MRLFPLFLFVFICQLLPAQRWTVGAQWIYYQDDFIPDDIDEYIIFTKIKDTTILQRPSSVMAYKWASITNNIYSESANHYFYLSEDSLKIDMFQVNTGEFHPLYDFSKNAGDTLHSLCDYPDFLPLEFNQVIDSVGTTYQGSRPLKVQWISQSDNGCIMYGKTIERIGNEHFLFAQPGFVDPPPGGYLRCFRDSLLTYPANTNCQLTVGVISINSNKALKVFPNPARDVIHWQDVEPSVSTLYDQAGRFIKSCTACSSMPLAEVQTGLYLLVIQGEKETFRQRIIKL